MRHAIETAPRDGNAVILEDDASGICDVAHWSAEAGEWIGKDGEPSKITPSHWYPMPHDKNLLQEHAGLINPSQVGPSAPRGRWLFAASSITATLIAAALIGLYFEQEPWLPSQYSRQTTLPELQQAEAGQAGAQARPQEAVQVKQAVEAPAPEARQSFEKEQRTEVLANELAEARRAIDALNLQSQAEAANSAQLLLQERQDAAAARQELTATAEQHHRALEEERARGAALASELAMARLEIETQAVQLRKASEEETGQLKQAEAAKSAQSLEQEREKTAALAQEAAAARQELTASTATHPQALDEERARSAALASELAMARLEIETQAVQLRKASDEETPRLKQAEAAKSAQSLEQERENTAALAQEAAAARQELTASTATHRQALDGERARSAALASELATAQHEIEMKTAQLRKANDEREQLKQAEAEKSAQSLEQEHEKTAALAQEVAAARQELTTSTAKHRQALDEERARRAALWSELATAQREIETQAAQLRKASEESGRLAQAEAAKSVQSLEQEREKAAALAQDATAAQQELTAGAEQHHRALEEERARGAALASELALSRLEIETNVALLKKARDDAAQFKQTAEKTTAELQQEHDRTEALSGALTMARESAQPVVGARTTLERTANSPITQMTQAVQEAAPKQPAAAVAQDGPEVARLMVRARALLDQGNIGAARIVLGRAAEMGSAQASFMLAETYDPVILSAWRTYGTRGDATKARDLYAKAHAGGIQEAKSRFDALDQ
jgi:hypothetical protein